MCGSYYHGYVNVEDDELVYKEDPRGPYIQHLRVVVVALARQYLGYCLPKREKKIRKCSGDISTTLKAMEYTR